MLSLRLSDLVSGAICVAYDTFTGNGMSTERFVEQVIYRVGGRTINEHTSLPSVDLPIVNENDLYAGAVSTTDHMVRLGYNTNSSLFNGLRATLSSAAADMTLSKFGVTDTILL